MQIYNFWFKNSLQSYSYQNSGVPTEHSRRPRNKPSFVRFIFDKGGQMTFGKGTGILSVWERIVFSTNSGGKTAREWSCTLTSYHI
jgi:hypothetical protein